MRYDSETIFSQHVVYKFVLEMCFSMCNQCPWSSEPGEYMIAKEACYHSGIISSGRDGLHPFGNVIYGQENVKVVER